MAFPRCDTCGEMAREVFRCECDSKQVAKLFRQQDALAKAAKMVSNILGGRNLLGTEQREPAFAQCVEILAAALAQLPKKGAGE